MFCLNTVERPGSESRGPAWENSMEGKSGEERSFKILLERVERHYKVLSEKVTSLDGKIDQGLQDVRREMATGFGDMRVGIKGLVKEVREHTHAS